MRRRTLLSTVPAAIGAAALVRPGPAVAASTGLTDLGVPLSDVLLIGGATGRGDDGSTWLWSASSGTPAHLNAIDPLTGKAVLSLDLPGAGGGYAVRTADDGTVYAGTYANGHLYRRKPGADAVEDLGQVLPNETYVQALAIDTDGTVYGATIGTGRAFGYDPATGKIRDYGQLVAGITYAQAIACADGKVYVGTGQVAHLIELDPVSGATKEIPVPAETDPAHNGVYDLNAYDGRLYVRIGGASDAPLCVYDIAAGAFTDTVEHAAGLNVSAPGPDGAVYFTVMDGTSGVLSAYRPDTKTVTPVGPSFSGRILNNRGIGWATLDDPDWPGQTLVGLLWRGQLFRYNPTTGKSDVRDTDVRREPIPILSLAAAGGVVYAGGFLNGGLSTVDGTTTTFHRFAQLESIEPADDGTLWLGAYPGSRLYHYDPAKAWSSPEYDPGPAGTPDNPVRAADLTPQHQNRGKAIAFVGSRVYLGTAADITTLQGQLVSYDPATGTTETFEPVTDSSVVSLTALGTRLFGGTSIFNSYSQPTPTQDAGRLFAWDTRGRKVRWQTTPVAGAPQVTVLAHGGLLYGVADGTVFAADPGTGRVLVRKELHAATGSVAQRLVRAGGTLYALVQGRYLYRITAGRFAVRLVLDHAATALAADGSTLYLADGPTLYRFTPGR